MKKLSYIYRIAMAAGAALLTVSLAACTANVTNESPVQNTSSQTVSNLVLSAAEVYAQEDSDTSWDALTATTITLSGSSASINGTGATAAGGVVTITAAGTYVLSGTLTDGQIIIQAGKEDTVRLVLNGTDISCSTSAAIDAEQSGKVILILPEGTKNTVADSAQYVYPNTETDEPAAAIFSKDNLTIAGSGSLTIQGNYAHGVWSKDALVITGGVLDVTAVKDGLRGRDSVAVSDGTFTIRAGNDGIKANNDEDAQKGWILLDGGSFTILAEHDGIQAETQLQVNDGVFSITAGGGAQNAAAQENNGGMGDPQQGRGQWGGGNGNTPRQDMQGGAGTAAAFSAVPPSLEQDAPALTAADSAQMMVQEEASDSAKGMKAGASVIVGGGSITIDSADDAVHSNGNVNILDGVFDIQTGDDGIHADNAVVINNGTITVSKSYEGIEGATIDINGGIIDITASDDGLNAAGGSDQNGGMGGPFGQDSFSGGGDYYIRISNGSVTVNASGDGIDSNGNLYFDGGTTLVSGPTNSANGALDYDGTCEITGGTLIATGSSGMAQAPASSSDQASLMVYYSETQKAGTAVTLKDESGDTLASFTSAKDFDNAVISTPEMVQGESYTLYSGETKLVSVTLSAVTTAINSDGSAASIGGRMGMGGNGRPAGNR